MRPLGLAEVTSFLVERYGTSVGEVIEAPRQGSWSRAYYYRDGERDLVIRFAPNAWNFEKDREFARCSSRDLPVPQVLELGVAFEGAYAVSERAFGIVLEDLDAPAMHDAFPSVLRALDALRGIDVADGHGFGPSARSDGSGEHPTWRDYLLSVGTDEPALESILVRGWRGALDRHPRLARDFDAARDALPTLVDACPEIRHLIHSDLLYGNVLVAEGSVRAVFDWGCALYGDFLYDVAWLRFWAPWYPGLDSVDVRSRTRRHYDEIGLAVPAFDDRLRCYEVHIGLAGQAYQAFIGAWDEVAATSRRTLDVLADVTAT